jgi:hypothetical protein
MCVKGPESRQKGIQKRKRGKEDLKEDPKEDPNKDPKKTRKIVHTYFNASAVKNLKKCSGCQMPPRDY